MNYFEIDPTKSDSERIGLNDLNRLNRLMKKKTYYFIIFSS